MLVKAREASVLVGSRAKSSGKRGFTLVELVIALTILIVSLLSISASTLRSHTLRRQNRDRVVAYNAVRAYSAAIHSLAQQAADSNPATWSQVILATYGPGGSIGSTFDVAELDRANPVVPVGSIQILTDETDTDVELGLEIGMPRDLNGDGLATTADVSGNACLLPVVVRIEWTGVSGVQRVTVPFYVMGY